MAKLIYYEQLWFYPVPTIFAQISKNTSIFLSHWDSNVFYQDTAKTRKSSLKTVLSTRLILGKNDILLIERTKNTSWQQCTHGIKYSN
nr:hypothetical transcript [Hymenolepis microstoma]